MLNTIKLDIASYKKSGNLMYFPYLFLFEAGFTATFADCVALASLGTFAPVLLKVSWFALSLVNITFELANVMLHVMT